jgi:hypothetical protein
VRGTMMQRAALALVVALISIVIVACDDNAAPDEDGVFVSMLSLIPDTEHTREGVAIGDVARVRELRGIERPPADAVHDQEALLDYYQALGASVSDIPRVFPIFLFQGGDMRRVIEFGPEIYESIGLTPFDVDQWVDSGFGPAGVHAFRGTVDADDLATRAEACAECPPLTIEERHGMQLFLWGEDGALSRGADGQPREQPPLFDRLGRGGNLAVMDGLVLYAHTGDRLRAIVDARAGDGSLANDESFRLAAEAMDGLGALGALITTVTQGPEFAANIPPQLADPWELEDGEPLLVRYELYAIGPGWDGAPYTAVALVHASEEAAQENARRLPDRVRATRFPAIYERSEETWGDVITDIDVRVEGRAVFATLHGEAVTAPVAGAGATYMLWTPLLRHE